MQRRLACFKEAGDAGACAAAARDRRAGRETQNDPDQQPWSITFAKRKPVELDAGDDRVKVTVRGSRFTSGEREFPAMDIWAAYRIEPGPGGVRLVRDGDVQMPGEPERAGPLPMEQLVARKDGRVAGAGGRRIR